jgi:Transglycosylase
MLSSGRRSAANPAGLGGCGACVRAVVRRHRRGRRSAWSRRVVRLAVSSAFMLLLLPVAGLVYYVYFDRTGLPDLERFIRFEPPTIGTVYDARNNVLIELAREYRLVISYDEVPVILRQAILAAEDKNFFSHSGVEYRALPRVVHKMAARSLVAWWNAEPGLRLRFPQGGSTLTQLLMCVVAMLLAVAEARTLSTGTSISVRTNEIIDVKKSDGRVFGVVVDQDVTDANGRVAIPRGSTAELMVKKLSNNQMALDLESVTVNGQRYAVTADAASMSSGQRDGIGRHVPGPGRLVHNRERS